MRSSNGSKLIVIEGFKAKRREKLNSSNIDDLERRAIHLLVALNEVKSGSTKASVCRQLALEVYLASKGLEDGS